MKALVVYDSAYGNTEKVAQAVAGAVGQALGAPQDVGLARASDVKPEQLAGLALLIVGSPTQRFSPLPTTTALLKAIPDGALAGVKVAAFDTRITESRVNEIRILSFFVKLFGYAAEPIAKRLEKKGGTPVAAPAGLYVGGTEGPLLEGELERAAAWAREIAGRLA